MIILLGVCLSCLGCWAFRAWELQKTRQEFSLASGTYEYAVGREIESNLNALHTLRAYVAVTKNLDAANFSRFASEAIRTNPSILSLEWVERIPAERRSAFEKELADRGIQPAYIRRNEAAAPAPARLKPEYFPVRFMDPEENANRIVGYDLKSSVWGREPLERAEQSGDFAVGARVRLVEKSRDGWGVPVYLAVKPLGYALVVFQIGSVLEKGLRRLKPEPIDFAFYDMNAPAAKRLLYAHEWGSGGSKVTYRSEEEALAPRDFKQVVRMDVGGRKWAMVMAATDWYLALRRTWQPWGVLLIGLALTGITAASFFLNITHARRDEELRHLRSRKAAEDALRASEERYALAARGSKDGLWDWDLQTGRVYYSPRWKAMLGYGEDEIGDSPEEWLGRIHQRDRERVKREIDGHCSGNASHFQSECRVLHRDGTYRWTLSRGVAVLSSGGVATRLAGSQTDLTDGRSSDHLTGLASRIQLNEQLQLSIDGARNEEDRMFAVLFLDLDRFKVVNDSLGHVAGDKLLVQIAERLTYCAGLPSFATGDITVARLGGDEFVVLIGRADDVGIPLALANAILESMRRPFRLDGNEVFVSTSIGIRIGDAEATPETLLRDADTAMYHAKSRGKRRYEVFAPAMRRQAVERLRIETDLRHAIANGQLVLHYQPKVCLVTGAVGELEALVRWRHPERGVIQPADFIAIAEDAGLILPLGKWVLENACRQMAEWQRTFTLDPKVRVSVNLSCKQFSQPDLLEQVLATVKETGLNPSRLSLEITESVLMENTEKAIVLLNRLSEEKIGLQIDDFGTGYSSLNYLHRLPFDAIKIDRAFVTEITSRPENAQIVRTIILLARTLGKTVIAEGVETEAQLRQLIEFGCDYAQGYLFSAAVDSDEAPKFFNGFSPVLDGCFAGVAMERS